MYRWLILLLFIGGCTTGNFVIESVLEGPFNVTNVVDGDTLDVYERVRLSGINTPETGECFYQEAKDVLSNLTLGKKVYLETDKSDKGKYGRLLRYVYVDDIFVNGYLVENGYARVYDKYKDDTGRYDELKVLELNAINNGLGVWSCVDLKEGCLFVSSKNSDKYHTLECKYAKKIKSDNLICYKSEPEDKEFSGC